MLRIPSWAKSDVTVSVNGEAVQYENAEGYAKITREWKNGDTVEITIPLGLTAEISRTASTPSASSTVRASCRKA